MYLMSVDRTRRNPSLTRANKSPLAAIAPRCDNMAVRECSVVTRRDHVSALQQSPLRPPRVSPACHRTFNATRAAPPLKSSRRPPSLSAVDSTLTRHALRFYDGPGLYRCRRREHGRDIRVHGPTERCVSFYRQSRGRPNPFPTEHTFTPLHTPNAQLASLAMPTASTSFRRCVISRC